MKSLLRFLLKPGLKLTRFRPTQPSMSWSKPLDRKIRLQPLKPVARQNMQQNAFKKRFLNVAVKKKTPQRNNTYVSNEKSLSSRNCRISSRRANRALIQVNYFELSNSTIQKFHAFQMACKTLFFSLRA